MTDDPSDPPAAALEDRFVLDVGQTVTDADRERVREAGLEIVTDSELIGYLGVRGPESAVAETGYDYVREMRYRLHDEED